MGLARTACRKAGLGMGKKGEAWHRRHALSLVAQLPEDVDDALLVIAYMRDVVENFLVPEREPASLSGARGIVASLRLVQTPIKVDAEAPPLAVVEPVEGQSGDDSH